jgi:hypothetical protein
MHSYFAVDFTDGSSTPRMETKQVFRSQLKLKSQDTAYLHTVEYRSYSDYVTRCRGVDHLALPKVNRDMARPTAPPVSEQQIPGHCLLDWYVSADRPLLFGCAWKRNPLSGSSVHSI